MLYLIDKPLADVGLRTARDDPEAAVVLLQDGVVLTPDLEVPTYAVERDVQVRGVDLADGIEPVSYPELLELVFDHEVRSFV